MNWLLLSFDQLTARQVYDLGRLRQEVFIIEQNCIYLDFDGKDLEVWHLLGYDDQGNLLAHARLLPKGMSYPDEPSIGRVVTHPSARGTGLGKELMREAMRRCAELFPQQAIRIEAQSYLEPFYQQFGFEFAGHPSYLLDGIWHTEMLYSPSTD